MTSLITLANGNTEASRELLKQTDTLVCGVRGSGDQLEVAGIALIDSSVVREHLQALVRRGALSCETGKITTSFIDVAGRMLRAVLVGLGGLDADPDEVRAAFGSAVNSVPSTESLVLCVPDDSLGSLRVACEGALLGEYDFENNPSREKPRPAPRSLVVFAADAESAESRACVDAARILGDAVAIARDLGNMTPSQLTPEAFGDRVVAEAQGNQIEVTVFDESYLKDNSFGGIVGVGQGSSNPPRLVKLDYSPAGAKRHIALVGKGITFDSGGLGLKDRAGMLWMKCDMGGAAAVYAAILAISRLGLPVRVTGWLALAENMPSGTAVRPADILRMRNGLTVEVTDTDAEGRLVMADALVAACEENPDLVVDMATLTGAQIIALGHRTSAVMARQDGAAASILDAATDSGEPMWRLPMPAHLAEHLKSPNADLVNMGGRDGGVIVGAHFLERFVTTGTPWVHIDIAGPAINTEARHGYTSHGATGAGVRTLVQLAVNAAK